MRTRYALLASALLLTALPALAQRNVPPSTFGNQATYLNRVIAADGGATGPRTETTYVLQSGGVYYVDGVIENQGWHLTVRAATGATTRPRIIPLAGSGGTTLGNVFTARGDLTLQGVYVTGQDDLGAFLDRIIRAQATGVTLRVEDSWLDYSGQSAIRVDNDNGRIIMRRSIVSNHGRMNSIDNGRAIDMRGTAVDEIDIVDNVFYNITSRAYRSGGGTAQRIRMEHNTFYNTGQRIVEVGRVRELVYQNNLSVNPGFTGVTAPAGPTTVPNVEYINPVGGPTSIVIRNDNTFTEQAVLDAMAALNPPYAPRPTFNNDAIPFIEAAGTGATLTSLSVTFANPPPTQRVVDALIGERDGNPATFANLEERNDPFDPSPAWNFTYPASSPLYTASTQGQPLGALFIFGLQVSREADPADGALALRAFPNPATSATRLAFSLAAPADVRLIVYDVLGREVARLAEGALAPGEHTLALDVRGLPAGTYLARLAAGERAETIRFTVVR